MLNKILDPIMNLIRFQKKKMALLVGLYMVFLYFLFPFNDLGDLVSGKISQATQGQVFLDFDNINLSLFLRLGLLFQKSPLKRPTPQHSQQNLFPLHPAFWGFFRLSQV